MALEQVLRQEVKQIKSTLKNGVKRSKISLASTDDKKYQIAQVNYFKNKTKNTHIIMPYGLAANPPENEEALMFNVMGQEENTASIPYALVNRAKNLQKKEVRAYNPYSSASVLFRNDGVTAINGSEFEGLVKVVDLTTKLNNLISEFDAHTHSGVQTGGGISGVPSTPATAFSKADYENTNVVHGAEGTGTTGGSSGGGGGTLDHSALINLDYASSGHTGFEKTLTFSTGLTRAGDTISVNPAGVDHNSLLNFVANKHIDHSGVNVNTTAPLQGGGDITVTRTLSITQASGSTDGYLSSTDWNTFNNKFTLPSLTSGSVLFSNGSTIIEDNTNFFWDNTSKYLKLNELRFLDNKKAIFGTGLDGEIYVDNSDIFRIKNKTIDKDIIISTNLGGVETDNIIIQASTGWVGIGKVPTTNLDILGNVLIDGGAFVYRRDGGGVAARGECYSNTAAQAALFRILRYGGSIATPTAILNGFNIGEFRFEGYDGAALKRSATFGATASENWTGSVNGTNMDLFVTPNGTTTRLQPICFENSTEIALIQNAGIAGSAVLKFQEKDTTPTNPTANVEVKCYEKDDKFVWQFNNGGTIRYFYIDLTASAAQQVQHTTTPI